jgi:tripartite-type tricarboxylate transporter receptor subunit TctC
MFRTSRRPLLLGATAALALPRSSRAAFPDRPIRALVGFPPGSIPDVSMRLLAPGLGERLGQSVVVENRPGAAGAIAAEALARATPDGHTILMMPANLHVLPAVRRNLAFDVTEVVPVAGAALAPLVLLVSPSLGVSDLAGFLRVARERGDGLAYGHSGPVASPNLCMSLLMQAAGITPTGITYRGDPEIITGLLTGAVQAGFVFLGSAAPQLREGRLRGLGITSEQRVALLPNLPTMVEQGQPSVTFSGWWAVAVPRGTPAEAQRKLVEAIRAMRGSAELAPRLEAAGALPLALDGAEMAAFNARERDRMAALYRQLGVQPE